MQTEVQLLQPINLEVAVERNLAAAWYSDVPDIEISGRLKPMNVNICGKWINFSVHRSPSSLGYCLISRHIGGVGVWFFFLDGERIGKSFLF